MKFKLLLLQIIVLILISLSLIGCSGVPSESVLTPTPVSVEKSPISATGIPQPSITPERIGYEFPDRVDPTKPYLFYLHGRIIEDQGIPAISPDYGEYQYEEILEALSGFGFIVLSEQRPKNTDGLEYARKISEQVADLLQAGVPAHNITVVGASKGAFIAMYVSHFLKNENINFVIMGICHPEVVEDFKQSQVNLYGNVLSIYDSADRYAGSCQDLFSTSEGKGLTRHEEVVLEIGTGHGILYQPLDEWILPAVQWANAPDP
jgi:hypothetical protein